MIRKKVVKNEFDRSKKLSDRKCNRAKDTDSPRCDGYKKLEFNWAINTSYLCNKETCSHECPSCFSFYELSAKDLFKIFKKLDDYRSWTWRAIEQSHCNTSCGIMKIHKLDTRDMINFHLKSALHLEDEELYKIEISGAHRVWGIRREAWLYIIWNDECHEFYKPISTNYTKSKKC
jgi:hypothetical protein